MDIITERWILIGDWSGKQSFSTGVGLKNRGGRGGGRASLRLLWRVRERAGLQGAHGGSDGHNHSQSHAQVGNTVVPPVPDHSEPEAPI